MKLDATFLIFVPLIATVGGLGGWWIKKSKTWIAKLMITLLSLLALIIGGLLLNMHITVYDLRILKKHGNQIIEELEKYKSQHKQYPEAIKTAGITPPYSRFGAWKYYNVSPDKFALSIGDYGWHMFELSWDQEKDMWYLDQ
jgi:hypothetical protein